MGPSSIQHHFGCLLCKYHLTAAAGVDECERETHLHCNCFLGITPPLLSVVQSHTNSCPNNSTFVSSTNSTQILVQAGHLASNSEFRRNRLCRGSVRGRKLQQILVRLSNGEAVRPPRTQQGGIISIVEELWGIFAESRVVRSKAWINWSLISWAIYWRGRATTQHRSRKWRFDDRVCFLLLTSPRLELLVPMSCLIFRVGVNVTSTYNLSL